MSTLVIKTVKSSGGDYSSLVAWEAGQQSDFVSGDTIQQADCYGFLDSGAVTIAGSTVDSTHYMRIVAASGAEAQIPWNTSTAYRLRGTFCPLTINQSYTRVERIQLETNIDDTNLTGVQIDRAAVDVLVRGCHIRSAQLGPYTFGGTSHGIDGGTDALGNRFLINNFIDWGNGFASGASNVVGIQTTSHDVGNTFVYNCTIIGGSATGAKGIHDSYSKIICKNVLAKGHLGGDFSSINSGNATNCASGDSSAVGTGARTSQTFTFVYAAGGDYHLALSDAGAKGFGVDLSADATYPFSTDFDDGARSGTWDIGADGIQPTPILGTTYAGTPAMSYNGIDFEGRLSVTIASGETVLCVRFSGNTNVNNWSSVTFNGASLTLRTSAIDGNVSSTAIWDLDNPSVGTYDVIWKRGADTPSRVCANGISNVNMSSPRGTPNTSAAVFTATPTVVVTTVNSDLVLDVVHHVDPTSFAANGAQTTQSSGSVDSTYVGGMSSKIAQSYSTTMSWIASSAGFSGIAAIGYKYGAAAPSLAHEDHDWRRPSPQFEDPLITVW